MIYFVGIDPGLSGGVVVLDEIGGVHAKYKTPVFKNEKGKTQYDIPGMVSLLKPYSTFGGKHRVKVVLEKSQSMPMQGVVSQWSIGVGYGLWQGILTALEVPFILVHPKTWQKAVLRDLDRSGDSKQASILFVTRAFPGDWRATKRSKNVDHNLTDACCLAFYAKAFG